MAIILRNERDVWGELSVMHEEKASTISTFVCPIYLSNGNVYVHEGMHGRELLAYCLQI